MAAELLNKYIIQADKLDSSTLKIIGEWKDRYPFFQTAHLLFIKNLYNLQGNVDKDVLNRTAVSVTDRKILYYLLNRVSGKGNEYSLHASETSIPFGKHIRDSLQENIADTLLRQKDICELDPEGEIKLVPGLAIDIRKEYGKDIELNDIDLSFRNKSNKNNEELLEISTEASPAAEISKTDTKKSDSSSYAPIGYNSNSIDVNQLYAVLDNLSGADSTDTTTTDSSESDTTSMGYQGSSQNTSFTELNFNLKPGQTAAFEHLAIGIRNIKKNFYKKIIALS